MRIMLSLNFSYRLMILFSGTARTPDFLWKMLHSNLNTSLNGDNLFIEKKDLIASIPL